MTMPMPEEVPPVDLGNALLGPTPVQMTLSKFSAPTGEQLLLATFRTPSTTFTVFLPKEDARNFGQQIVTEADAMTGLVIPQFTFNGHGPN